MNSQCFSAELTVPDLPGSYEAGDLKNRGYTSNIGILDKSVLSFVLSRAEWR